MPPASRNQRVPTGGDTPAPIAASSLDRPAAINAQKRSRSSRRAIPGRPGDLNLSRNARSDRRLPAIATFLPVVLRRPFDSAQHPNLPRRFPTFAARSHSDLGAQAFSVGCRGRNRRTPWTIVIPAKGALTWRWGHRSNGNSLQIGHLADYVLISFQKSGTSRRPNDDIT